MDALIPLSNLGPAQQIMKKFMDADMLSFTEEKKRAYQRVPPKNMWQAVIPSSDNLKKAAASGAPTPTTSTATASAATSTVPPLTGSPHPPASSLSLPASAAATIFFPPINDLLYRPPSRAPTPVLQQLQPCSDMDIEPVFAPFSSFPNLQSTHSS